MGVNTSAASSCAAVSLAAAGCGWDAAPQVRYLWVFTPKIAFCYSHNPRDNARCGKEFHLRFMESLSICVSCQVPGIAVDLCFI